MERKAQREMVNGNGIRGRRAKGMDSALWLPKGKGAPGRRGKLAAASRR